LGIPFLLLGLALDRISGWLKRMNRRTQRHPGGTRDLVSIISGLFLIAMGIIVYTNTIGKLNAWFYRIFKFTTIL
jgi:hypothetical protein